jgi:hypothetical protein
MREDEDMRTAFGLFLLAHGAIHASWFSPAPPHQEGAPAWPFDLTSSWLLTPLGVRGATIRVPAAALCVVALIGFVAAGAGVLGVPGMSAIWRPLVTISAFASLAVLILLFRSWFTVGVALDVGLLAGTLVYGEKLSALVGR